MYSANAVVSGCVVLCQSITRKGVGKLLTVLVLADGSARVTCVVEEVFWEC